MRYTKEFKLECVKKFKVEDKELDIKIDNSTNSFWLSMNDIITLYGRDKSRISRRIQSILKEQKSSDNRAYTYFT